MPMVEVPADLAEVIADMLGVYGGHDEDELKECDCRVCFVAGMTQRIRDAAQNEQLLAKMTIDGTAP